MRISCKQNYRTKGCKKKQLKEKQLWNARKRTKKKPRDKT